MIDQQNEWVISPGKAWDWAQGWVSEAKLGGHHPVRMIHEAARNFKNRFCTDGLWAPGAQLVYDMLIESAEMAQDEYEHAQPGIEH